jgi:thiol-disulfide isomerase/thioredoxin
MLYTGVMRNRIMRNVLFIFLFVVSACSQAQDETQFSQKALAEKMISLDGEEVTFSEIIEQYKGKKVVIDIWGSWCGDCIQGMPIVKELQKDSSDEVIYLFLSLDTSLSSWKKGIQRHQVKGAHYFMPSGWKSDFNTSIDLDWIPRYMVVDKTGAIELFKATKATSEDLKKAIQSNR